MISRIWPVLLLSYFVVVADVFGFAQIRPLLGDVAVKQEPKTPTPFQHLPQADMSAVEPNPDDPCEVFQNPRSTDPERKVFEFYSPGFPNYYPNQTECISVLEAPSGYVIRLDFREFFRLENSTNCKHDYLEVRDGARGYDNIIKHPFCGTAFPPELQSKDRHLWIHFKSDKTIEDKGFKAVYEFVPRSPKVAAPELLPCEKNVTGFEGFVKSDDVDQDYINWTRAFNMSVDCLWNITVEKNWKIQLQFEVFSLTNANNCDSNFLDVYSDKTDASGLEKSFCGSIADAVSSNGNVMYIRFYADQNSRSSKFKANFTAYRDLTESTSDKCTDEEFDCDDKTCISSSLKCNGLYNCRFRFDEEDCPSVQDLPFGDDHIIIIMVIFTLILSGMCFTFIYNCAKKLVKDHQAIQEYIRKSREELTEMDKLDNIIDSKHPAINRSRSNSSHSSGHRCETVNAMVNTPCYVPGGDILPILIRPERSISPANDSYHHQNIYTVDTDNPPEMCDSACQTRESLFTTQGYSSTHSTPNHSVHNSSRMSPTVPFSTFGYKREDNNSKFRAEAKIEVSKLEEKRRPYSVQTTKSAPDVIVTH